MRNGLLLASRTDLFAPATFTLDFGCKFRGARSSTLLRHARALVRLNLAIEFVDDVVDRRVHILRAFFRVEVLTARRDVHVRDVLGPLDRESDLGRHRLT